MPTATVILAYAHYERYLQSLANTVATLYSSLHVTRLVVVTTFDVVTVTSVFRERIPSVKDVKVLAHDNQNWEFGAYQRGIDALQSDWTNGNVLVVLNDTAGRHSVLTGAMLRSFVKGVRGASISTTPTIVGEADSGASGSLYGLDASRWLRSCFFALNTAGLECLGWRVSCPELAQGLSYGGRRAGLVFSQNVSAGLADSVNRWLLNGRAGARWYRSSVPETPAQAHFLVQKALSILNERHLSARLLSCGVAIDIFPITPANYAIYRFWRKWNSLRRQSCP